MAASATTVGGGHFVLAGVGQWAAGTPHILLTALRLEAAPQTASGVGRAGCKDEDDNGELHYLGG